MSEFLESMKTWEGFAPVRKSADEQAMAEALNLIQNKAGYTPRRHAAILEEAITTTDFPYLFGQVIDRQLLANYKGFDADWKNYMRVTTVPDFNTVRREKLHGTDSRLPVVPEKGEYQPSTPTNCRYTYNVKKYGRQFDISWEAMINDSLGAFQDVPQRMALAAARTEYYFATSLFAAAGGDGNANHHGTHGGADQPRR